ncbi:hypothetical protein [Halobellus rufus]|uniref:hypothetical protein n=1 Tax=Halobellus rufus TaxID=1448860 RepID=UPI00067959F8|nr:hypothetical protein [Halobellus rufus]
MTTQKIRPWLLVALAVVALAVAAPVVSAHGDEPMAEDAHPDDRMADGWTAWMEEQMTEHMGPDAVAWMESQMGTTAGEMRPEMADNRAKHGVGPRAGAGHC